MSREALAELALLNAELHAQRDAAARQAEAYKQRAESAERTRDELRAKHEPPEEVVAEAAVESSAPARRPSSRKASGRKRSG